MSARRLQYHSFHIKKIKNLTQVTAGGTPSTRKKEYWNGNIRWMNSGEIHLKRINEVKGRITMLGLQNSSTKIIPPKSILIALAGQGKTRGTTARLNLDTTINQNVAGIIPSKFLSSDFLHLYLNPPYDDAL